MTAYAEFLRTKMAAEPEHGRVIDPGQIHPLLHRWQAELVTWAVRKGRAALWEDTGMGKTIQQLEWARLSGDTSLVVAPLAVCHQTVREAEQKLGLPVRYVRSGADVDGPGVWITNTELADRFDPTRLDAVVLDEASILKNSTGKTRTLLVEHFADVPRRLACTATPAPNDPEELTSQAEFLGVCSRVDMLATYFIHDDQGWRLKRHAVAPMYRWMSTWAVALRRPSDLGYTDDGYELPGLEIVPELLPVDIEAEGQLFATDLGGVGGRAKIRKSTLLARCDRAVQLVDESHGWQRASTKLARWDGSPSTPRTARPDTKPIKLSGSDAGLKDDLPTRTVSTCGPTTSETESGSSSTSETLPPDGTPDDASGTPPMSPTGTSASGWPSCGTRSPSGTTDSAVPTGSLPPSTTTNSSSRAADARSAEPNSATTPAGDSSSITATSLVGSEASSVAPATSASGSSETTPSFLSVRPGTSADLEPWIIWCGLNDEQDYLARALGDRCFSVTGSMSPEDKADLMLRWVNGERPVLITKPKIAGFGMNFQHCARMAFVGLSDSYEQYYQAIRRCYRYGQPRVVRAHVVLSELEGQIARNVDRKGRESAALTDGLVAEMRAARTLQEAA